MCLVDVKKWKDEKYFCFDLEENEMIENTIYLNLPLCSYYNFFIKIFYKDKKKVLLG